MKLTISQSKDNDIEDNIDYKLKTVIKYFLILINNVRNVCYNINIVKSVNTKILQSSHK